MKRISSVLTLICLLPGLASSLSAQEEDILGKKIPPLESLKAFAHEEPGIAAGTVAIGRKESQSLSHARIGERITLPQLDQYIAHGSEPLQFRRIDLFAPGARILVMGASGAVEWERDARQFFIATNVTTGVGLAVDTNTGEINGYAIKGDSKMSLEGQLDGGIQLRAVEQAPEEESICSMQLDEQSPESLEHLNSPMPRSQSDSVSGSSINYQAVVAVDTDNEWMDHRGDDPAIAMTWITDAFLAMNVFYERDVETHLLIGDVILRMEADPYSIASNASDQMNEFATYWRFNLASIDRDFATLFSGRGVAAGTYSGIAWLDQFCVKGVAQGDRTRGSYSFNAMGANRTAANTAIFIGHELGHNMGSPHTHCYSPVIDQCYSGESGCYTGPEVCPAGGKGTIMSYCHTSSGASCGTNKSEFHPRVQTLLESRLAANNPGCIADYEEPPDPGETPIFEDNFESP